MQPRDLSAHSRYVPGEGTEEVARELGLDPDELVALSSNENPFGPSPAAVEVIRGRAATVAGYPKASHTDLTERLAQQWSVSPSQIWLAPGADGAIDCLSRATLEPGDGVLVPDPGFAYYGMSARYHHGTASSYPVRKDADFQVTADDVLEAYDDERMVFLTSPHNPTGSTVALDTLESIADRTDEETLVVVDEAYGEYAAVDSARALIADRDTIAVLRTFSKAYGLAGLRLGYALVPEEWADAYSRVNTPFAVNELACRAGSAALEDDDHLQETIETARWARQYMHEELAADTWESGGNFVLADVGDATAVAEASKRQGVIVRDCTSFGLPGCIRISCGTEPETKRAVQTLNEVIAELELDGSVQATGATAIGDGEGDA
jgi:histidinol-phosphate aminotransferase